MRFDRRLLTHFEWFLPLVAICVSALGILTVYSASYVPGSDAPAPMAMRQLVWCVAGLGAMLAMLSFDYRRLERHALLERSASHAHASGTTSANSGDIESASEISGPLSPSARRWGGMNAIPIATTAGNATRVARIRAIRGGRRSERGELVDCLRRADEAHELVDTAGQYFGFSVSCYRVQELRRDIGAMSRVRQFGSSGEGSRAPSHHSTL